MQRIKINWFIITIVLFCFSCSKQKGILDNSDYPNEVAKIILTKCSTSGCHNAQSKDAASGLSLASWQELFAGGRNGPVVIPYRPDFSSLCFFTNSFSDLGPIQVPLMPLQNEPLSREDYLVLKNWIMAGAPNKNGEVKFSSKEISKKIYITNRLCDVVTVLDAKSKLPMRYISVGNQLKQEFPYSIKVAPNSSFWLVSFFSPTGLIQKFNAATDELMGELNLGQGSWSTFDISADSRYGFFCDNSREGKIACVDLESLTTLATYTSQLVYPKSPKINDANHKLYVGTESGNFIYVLDIFDQLHPKFAQKIIDGSNLIKEEYSEAPEYFQFSKDNKFCFVSCSGSTSVKILSTVSDSVIASITMPSSPAMMQLAQNDNLFVSCPNDTISFSNGIGSVAVINTKNFKVTKLIQTGFQPYGLGINEEDKTIAVVNANISAKGPAPHHTSVCSGRNGYITYIDMNTLELIPKKRYELAVYPFEAAIKTN